MDMTPYQRHVQSGHKTTTHSPNGTVIMEECEVCGVRYLHDPMVGYPIMLRPKHPATAKATKARLGRRRVAWERQSGVIDEWLDRGSA
jgi:hypothetical protein